MAQFFYHGTLTITKFRQNIHYRAKLSRAKMMNFLKSDENFAQQSFAQQDNHNLSELLVVLFGSPVLTLKDTFTFIW